jgi:hypothetical protein
MNSYEGVTDNVRWKLAIDNGMMSVRTLNGRQMEYFQRDPVSSELTLYDLSQVEAEAAIEVVRTMRAAGPPEYPREPVRLGNRFSGLDLD